MGKAQSKRSVDITTDTKKGTEEEVTEKMGKIEDLDKKEVVNGDATISEKSDPEKKDPEVVENDKGMATEKDVDVQASGDSADPQNTVVEASTKDEGGSAATAEEISPLADDSIKKSKKEKVKKKWSFRNLSFGKKDKQKPAKSEEAAEEGSAAVNGADAEEKTKESENTQKDNGEKTTTETTHENGNATPQELNEEQQNGEKKLSDDKSIDLTANTTNNATTTETREPVQNETAAVSNELSEKTENTAVINNETKTSENATTTTITVDDASKNVNGLDQQEPQKTDDKNASSAEASTEKTKATTNDSSSAAAAVTTNGEVVDQIHQNGDHGETADQAAIIEKSKAQIEVNTNTDNHVSAATTTLDSISSTISIIINPSNNVQTHVQDLIKAPSEETEEIVEMVIEKPTTIDTDIIACQTILVDGQPSVQNEIVISVKEEVSDHTDDDHVGKLSKIDETENSFQEKLGVDSTPPPLPISPPPSQVSVFAFTNNEDSIQTKNNFEPALNNLIEEEKTEISSLPPASSELPIAENDNNQIINSLPITNESETCVNETVAQEQNVLHHDDDVVKIDIYEETNVELDEEETNMNKDLNTINNMVPLPSPVVSEETQNNKEEASSVVFAAAVINEITETAAEIVNQQFNSNKEQIMDELSSPSSSQNIDECQEDKINEENLIEKFGEDIVTLDVKTVQNDQDLIGVNDVKNSEEEENHLPSIVIEQTNNKTIEECCSLDFTESNLKQHQNKDEEEMNSINESNSLDEMLLDPTKEFATAKDIKDNVTVAEITQELSVTCE